MRKTVLVISFSPIASDARVLRQIKRLARHYDLVVLGLGKPHPSFEGKPGMTWLSVDYSETRSLRRLRKLLLATTGRLSPTISEAWYWAHPAHRRAFAMLQQAPRPHAVHANDLSAVPLAARLAFATGARLVVDLHEYAPLEFEEQLAWRLVYPPFVRYALRRYVAQADATITVTHEIARRYHAEYGFEPLVILNAPERCAVPVHSRTTNSIRMVHHGAAIRGRRLEAMIETIALCDERFSLDFMLTGDPLYSAELRALAQRLAPGRITFREPVPPEQIVPTLAEYDLGLCYIYPSNYNYLMSLPNKLFDFINAGLAVCVGPSPAMVSVVQQHDIGVVAPSFAPTDIAAALNSLSAPAMSAMRANAHKAAQQLNADVELAKLDRLYQRLLGS